ncbi:hypothetical protein M9H77_18281 [Catharanthus roseus]|uniref:Uncharacterized protein n=1 Tax=Catharanthus roseus TaxID=4058 RepID=A0ACC0B720_CATRO|nr:hypothetical protein M9H77_18281 [Catharanthus roseus]
MRTHTGISIRLVAILRSSRGHWTVAESSKGAISQIFFIVLLLISLGTHSFKRGVGERRLSTGAQQVIKFTTFNKYGYSWDEENQVWIPPSEEDRMREHHPASFRSIKKATQTGLGAFSLQPVENDDEADESYNPQMMRRTRLVPKI